MRRLKFGVLALVAVVAAFAATAASALAALPEFTVQTNATSAKQAVTSTFENSGALKGTITSSELKGELTATSKSEGKFHIDFEKSECSNSTLGKGAGNSKGDSSGVILVLGTYSLASSTSNKPLALLTLEEVEIECHFKLSTLKIFVKGTVLGSLSPEHTSTTEFTQTVQASGGTQDITEYLNDSEKEVEAQLLTKISGGSFSDSTQNESAAVSITAEKATELT